MSLTQSLKLAADRISLAKDIVISGHINPDGDSLGSLLSLGLAIESLGKRVYMLSPDPLPARYRRLPGSGRIIKKIDQPVDLAIAVDCSNKEILGPAWQTFQKAKDILEIDHHDFRRPFGDFAFVDTDAAAVGELIYLLLGTLKININQEIAENLLASIIVETSSFSLPNVRPFTFEVCTGLVKKKVDFYKLVDMIFWSESREAVILSGICLSRCKFISNYRIVWSVVRKKDFKATGGQDEDVDAVADKMRSIKGVQIAVLFREKGGNKLRVSLRSKDKINIAGIAEYYGGGGHFDVAGCSIPDNFKSMQGLLSKAEALLP